MFLKKRVTNATHLWDTGAVHSQSGRCVTCLELHPRVSPPSSPLPLDDEPPASVNLVRPEVRFHVPLRIDVDFPTCCPLRCVGSGRIGSDATPSPPPTADAPLLLGVSEPCTGFLLSLPVAWRMMTRTPCLQRC